MKSTKENHVPVLRQLRDARGEPGIKLGIEHGVVFKDQNTLSAARAGLLYYRQMAA